MAKKTLSLKIEDARVEKIQILYSTVIHTNPQTHDNQSESLGCSNSRP